MAISHSGGIQKAEMNVTPLIDVLLVLIIIFMMIQPLKPRGELAEVPQTPKTESTPPPERTVVLEVLRSRDGNVELRLNHASVTEADLPAMLKAIYQARAEKVIFLKGDAELDFFQVAQLMDLMRTADPGLRMGLITADMENAD